MNPTSPRTRCTNSASLRSSAATTSFIRASARSDLRDCDVEVMGCAGTPLRSIAMEMLGGEAGGAQLGVRTVRQHGNVPPAVIQLGIETCVYVPSFLPRSRRCCCMERYMLRDGPRGHRSDMTFSSCRE